MTDNLHPLKCKAARLGTCSLVLALLDPALVFLAATSAPGRYLLSFFTEQGRAAAFVIVLLPPIIGLVLGILTHTLAKWYPSLFRIRLLAYAGIACASVIIGGTLLIAPICARTHIESPAQSCLSNQRQIVIAASIYASDHDGKLPSSLIMQEGFLADRSILRCPEKKATIGYGYNRSAVGLPVARVRHPDKMILSADGGNAQHLLTEQRDIDESRHAFHGAPFNWRLRYPCGFVVGYADTHVTVFPAGTRVQLQQ